MNLNLFEEEGELDDYEEEDEEEYEFEICEEEDEEGLEGEEDLIRIEYGLRKLKREIPYTSFPNLQ